MLKKLFLRHSSACGVCLQWMVCFRRGVFLCQVMSWNVFLNLFMPHLKIFKDMQSVSKSVFIWPSNISLGVVHGTRKHYGFPCIVLLVRFSQVHRHKLLPYQFNPRPTRGAIPVAFFEFPLLVRIPTPQAIVRNRCNCTVHSHITEFFGIVRAIMVCWEHQILLTPFC